MQEVRVKSFDEALTALYPKERHEFSLRYRSPFVFRGLSRAAWPMITSFQRMPIKQDYREQMEGHLLRSFRTYAADGGKVLPHDADRNWSDWRWLTMAQHHGLPTRFMDWTNSPLTALHFATAETDHYDHDGVVWVAARAKANFKAPPVLRDQLRAADTGVYTLSMLEHAAADLAAFDKLSSEPFVVFFEPPSIDQRIVNQLALFSVMSDREGDITAWLEQKSCDVARVVIDKAAKWEIRDKLDQSGITERTLFPGLDGLSAWLKRHYMLAKT